MSAQYDLQYDLLYASSPVYPRLRDSDIIIPQRDLLFEFDVVAYLDDFRFVISRDFDEAVKPMLPRRAGIASIRSLVMSLKVVQGYDEANTYFRKEFSVDPFELCSVLTFFLENVSINLHREFTCLTLRIGSELYAVQVFYLGNGKLSIYSMPLEKFCGKMDRMDDPRFLMAYPI